jgi:hypothetical protein
VPNLWDKAPEAQSPPELNPLTNPVLEKNLERWAKVYFGTAPAKRDQAVSALLEEIMRESGKHESETSGPVQSARPYFARDPKFERPLRCLPTSQSTRAQVLQPVRSDSGPCSAHRPRDSKYARSS